MSRNSRSFQVGTLAVAVTVASGCDGGPAGLDLDAPLTVETDANGIPDS